MEGDASLTPARMAQWDMSLPRILKDLVIPTMVDPELVAMDPAHSYANRRRLRARVARVDAYMARRTLVTRAEINAGMDKQAFEVNNALVPAILAEPPRLVDLFEAALYHGRADDFDVLMRSVDTEFLKTTLNVHRSRLCYAAGHGGLVGLQLLETIPATYIRPQKPGTSALLIGLLHGGHVEAFVDFCNRRRNNPTGLYHLYARDLSDDDAAAWHDPDFLEYFTKNMDTDALNDFYDTLVEQVPTGSRPMLLHLSATDFESSVPTRPGNETDRLLLLLWELIDDDDANGDARRYSLILKRMNIHAELEAKQLRSIPTQCLRRTPTRPFLSVLREWSGFLSGRLMRWLHGWAIQHGKEDLLDSISPCRGDTYPCPWDSLEDGMHTYVRIRVTTAEEVRQRLDAFTRAYPQANDLAHTLPALFEGLTPVEWERLAGTAAWPLVSSPRYAFLLRSDTDDDARIWHMRRCSAAELLQYIEYQRVTNKCFENITTMSVPCLDTLCDKIGTGRVMEAYAKIVAEKGAHNALAKLEHLFARYQAQPSEEPIVVIRAVGPLKRSYDSAEMDRFIKKVIEYGVRHMLESAPPLTKQRFPLLFQ